VSTSRSGNCSLDVAQLCVIVDLEQGTPAAMVAWRLTTGFRGHDMFMIAKESSGIRELFLDIDNALDIKGNPASKRAKQTPSLRRDPGEPPPGDPAVSNL
jgi:hypothetical protein